ncbi:hypothetical protein EFK50_03505 [Nocardioides marmoriginsengisoli]|uniref:DUF3558 domain-containing protein n=1 Tax=Nocardioides marmoriginsengisoli TaxID=661483 RepID=A0A3N0CQ78_9ACTN|nr:hypothetical protein EFK50_03505 [Nocardioides marmoriginsengisoli]
MLTGCGKDAEKDPVAADPTTPTVSSSPTPTATPTPTPTRKPKPTRTPTRPAEGNGDGEGDDTPAADGGGICADLDAGEVAAILGGAVTGSAMPPKGCAFNRKNPSAPAASFAETSFAGTPGGMDGAKTGATSSVEGEPVDLTGIGDAAFVVTGTAFGGTDLQGAGAVRVGDRLVNVTVAQSAGLPRAKVRALVVSLLTLAARSA